MFKPRGNRNIEGGGDNGTNNTGDHNHFGDNHFHHEKSLNRSYLYDFCLKFANVENPPENYNTEFANDINDKMCHNEIDLYKDIFLDCDFYLGDVETILADIPNRERILTRINFQYKKFKMQYKTDSKDELCERVFDYLITTVDNDPNAFSIMVEDRDLAIHSLMYHAFVKCKLLDPIPTKKL
ncbi:ABC-three component system protein [Planococcus maritimus]|uniref:ABC-three component system protein n=1 Tax=Planococcus maritimus TaxID=192421 RepID=UPI0007947F95|nr:hypothetical protein [Planococcus maritimus]KYG58817.1 hypothetical protein AY633_00820 [Planococcus maritimus]